MIRVILYIAISSDGFIADKDGGVGWLDEYTDIGEGYGFEEFYQSIDALAIGNNTYKQVLTFGPWHFNGKTSYIFSDKNTPTIDNKDIEFVGTDIQAFMKKIEAKGVKRLWLMGGAQLAESFYRLGLIDEVIITMIPKKLGEGIALSPELVDGCGLALVNTIQCPLGMVQYHYR